MPPPLFTAKPSTVQRLNHRLQPVSGGFSRASQADFARVGSAGCPREDGPPAARRSHQFPATQHPATTNRAMDCMVLAPGPGMTPILCVIFVLSGAAGLIYESIWTRYLGLFVGHDAYAQIIVLVIFLGGMSLGAMAGEPALRAAPPTALWIRGGRVRGRHASGWCFTTSFRCATGWAYASVFPALAGALGAHRRQVGHRGRADPAAVGAARHDLPAHERRRAPAGARPAGPDARAALLRQQPRRGGRRAGRRVLPGGAGGPSRHAARPPRCSTSSSPPRRSA